MLRMTADDPELRLDRVFHALADRTRREILRRVAEREHRVTDLARPFDMSLNAVSKHIKILERAGLLTRTIDGRVHRCRLNGEPLEEVVKVVAFYRRYWEDHMDHLARALQELESAPPSEERP